MTHSNQDPVLAKLEEISAKQELTIQKILLIVW